MGTNSRIFRLWSGILSLGLTAAAATSAQVPVDGEASAGSERRAQNLPAPTISAAVYERLAEARACLDEGNPECALELLGRLAERRGLSAFDRANMLSVRSFACFDLQDFDCSARAYEELLSLPRDELTPGIVEQAMRNLSSTYWNLERLHDALATFEQWIALPTTEPVGDDWYRKGMLHYQVEEFTAGVDALTKAIASAAGQDQLGEESWYQLLAALYSELEDQERVIETVTILAENWTKREHVLQLAGQLSQADRQRETLVLFEVAYAAGWLTTSSNLVNLATMHLQFGAPYKATLVLEEGLGNGKIESTERTWSLLGQAWQLAGHKDESIPAFERAAQLADDGNADLRLARAYALRQRWEDCVNAAQRGIERGELTAADRAWIQLGHCQMSLKLWDEAETAFARAERSERSRDSALDYLAYLLSLRNEERDNERQLREAQEIRANGRPGGDLTAEGLMQPE